MVRLLLVEDDHADQLIFERNIKKSGVDCSLEICGTIKDGIDKTKRNEYDVVFCDFNLPDGTALEFLVEQKVAEDVPVIVLTSRGDVEKATESLKNGAFDFITKDNVNAPSLERIINSITRVQDENKVRKELESKLAENNANTRAILDNTTDGIWSLDCSGRILIMNEIAKENFRHHLKYEAEIGDLIFDHLPADYSTIFKPQFERALLGKHKTLVQEFNEQGYTFFLEVTCSPILNNENVINGATYFARSVTERIEANEKIKEAKRTAEQALEFKSRFLANMSHEIRTPMNAMIGFTEVLNKTQLDSEQKEYVDIIHNSGEDLLVIINDILDLSKIQTGKMELREDHFNLDLTVKNVIRLHRYKAEDKGNILNLNLDKNLPKWLSGDVTRLAQILNNLISNALKFTENGTVSLDVKKLDDAAKGVTLNFTVRDTGIGIPKDKLTDIFKDFTQVESSLQRSAMGTGLGLAIVSSLVELMDGSIEVASEMGQGSEFSVTVCLAHGTEVVIVDTEVEGKTASIEGLKILVCDDVELNRLLVSKTLKPYNVELFFAENGKIAVDMVRSVSPDVVFMDLQMPVMDGYQATEILRSFSDVPIIAMTSHLLNEEHEQCVRVGMNGFVSKPFKEKDLVNLLINQVVEIRKDESIPLDKWDALEMPTLIELADGDEEFAKSLFDSFLKLVDDRIDKYGAALKANDMAEIYNIAHVFLSSFTTFEMTELKLLARRIQERKHVEDDLVRFPILLAAARECILEKRQLLA